MATTLEMNGLKANSFSVKDLLDLPAEGKGVLSCASPTAGDGSLDLSASRAVATDMATVTGQFYDNDNPYTRWLHNNDHMQYGRKLSLWVLS